MGLVLYTWKRLVENVFVGLTGRRWVIQVSVNLGCGVFLLLALFGAWLYYHHTFFTLLLWPMGGLVLLKLLAAGWACRAAGRRGLIATRTLVRLLGLSFVVACSLVFLLRWLVPSSYASLHSLGFGVVLFLPLARLMAAPLALAWNRHR
jgi:hypothetical protein